MVRTQLHNVSFFFGESVNDDGFADRNTKGRFSANEQSDRFVAATFDGAAARVDSRVLFSSVSHFN